MVKERIERDESEEAKIGEMLLRMESTSLLTPKLRKSSTLITGTPIVIRIHRRNYEKYGITPPKNYNYVYWRSKYSFEAFIKQLEAKLFKKYNEFYKTKLKEFPIFEQFLFKKKSAIISLSREKTKKRTTEQMEILQPKLFNKASTFV